MLELMIEQWKNPDGSASYLWSLWSAGKRVGMGRGAATAEAAETEGLVVCRQAAGREPDRVTRL
jgi:hypothetical protein